MVGNNLKREVKKKTPYWRAKQMDEHNLEMEEQLARAREVAVDHQDLYPATKQDVEVYIRTYTTMLRSSGEVEVKALGAGPPQCRLCAPHQRTRQRA